MNERAIIAFIFIFGLVNLTNLLMFGIVRSLLQGGLSRRDILKRVLTRPFHRSNSSIDELSERVIELQTSNPSHITKTAKSETDPSQPDPGLEPR